MDSIVTVTVPAASYDLVDIDEVKEELSIADNGSDGMLQRWITEESQRVADYCGRVFQQETVSEEFRINGDRWDRRGTDELLLSRIPLASISSVTEDCDPLTESAYRARKDAGLLYRLCDDVRTCWYACKIVVVYVAGFDPVPSTVSQACLTLLKHRRAGQTRDPALRSLTIEGVGQKQFWVGTTGDVGDMPPEVADALYRYRALKI